MDASNDTSISGLGPHGERAAPPSRVTLSDADVSAARDRGFSVAIVFHTLEGDWAKQSMAGIVTTLGTCGAVVSEVVDCAFDPARQIEALERLAGAKANAIISIPVANAAVVDAHRAVSESGKHLILHDNVPTGLLPGKDYTSLVSADNFGLGLIGAELLSPHVGEHKDIGLLTYGVDFYATNEREIAFGRWMRTHRPDLRVHTERFADLDRVAEATDALIDTCPDLAGLFVVWDIPAIEAMTALDRRGLATPITTVDLGRAAATSLARGERVAGIAAQQPYAQGRATAQTAILSMLGLPVPGWIALPGLPVTQSNVIERYQQIWSTPAPPEILAARTDR